MLESSGNRAVTPATVRRFADVARQRIRLDGGGYRRDHLRAFAQRIEVAETEVRIMGSKGKLLRTLTAVVAPFHRQMNGIGDAIIIETYIDAFAEREGDDVLAFVTHNIHGFSQKGADTRLPHPDLAALFDGAQSLYSTNLGTLLNKYASDLIEEITFDREYSQESRVLSELLEAEDELTTQIWYGRKWGIIAAVESGKQKRVPGEVWEHARRAARHDRRRHMGRYDHRHEVR